MGGVLWWKKKTHSKVQVCANTRTEKDNKKLDYKNTKKKKKKQKNTIRTTKKKKREIRQHTRGRVHGDFRKVSEDREFRGNSPFWRHPAAEGRSNVVERE